MLSDSAISEQLKNVLDTTNFAFLGERYEGKVRDNYTLNSGSLAGNRVLITTDRLSCFDKVVTTVPFKGQTLNQMAVKWFELSEQIISNHIIDVPDPNVMLVRSCEILPVEVIVRAYITGSAWRDYEAGRDISGIALPKGLKPSQRFDQPIITPSTKAKKGDHDLPISEREILSSGLVDRKIWDQARTVALSLFELAASTVAKQGLILVDTKYEFGLHQGKLLLADEIHTMDSSRYWLSSSYQSRFENGEAPEMLDKEPTRQWLLSQGYKGDGPIPEFSDQHRVEIAKHYIKAYERITNSEFKAELGSVKSRIEGNLRSLLN